MIAGAVFGAMLASRRGTLAYVGAGLAGGLAGMLVGALLGQLAGIAYAFLRAAAKIYWELLTGRRKLPTDSTSSERHWVFVIIGSAFAIAVIIMAGVYFFGSEAQRARLFGCAAAITATCLLGVLILKAHHRRHPARKSDLNQE